MTFVALLCLSLMTYLSVSLIGFVAVAKIFSYEYFMKLLYHNLSEYFFVTRQNSFLIETKLSTTFVDIFSAHVFRIIGTIHGQGLPYSLRPAEKICLYSPFIGKWFFVCKKKEKGKLNIYFPNFQVLNFTIGPGSTPHIFIPPVLCCLVYFGI